MFACTTRTKLPFCALKPSIKNARKSGIKLMETHATTILAVRKNGLVALAGDGQVTMGQNMIMKHAAQKCAVFMTAKFWRVFAGGHGRRLYPV